MRVMTLKKSTTKIYYSKLEGKLRDQVTAYLKTRRDIWFMKVVGNSIQKAGVADFLICYRGLFLAVELKRPDGKGEATTRQLLELKKVRNAGGIGVVIESLDELIQLLGELDHEHQTTNH